MITTLKNTPVSIDFTELGTSTGWTLNGDSAVHEICNAGSIYWDGYPIVSGDSYIISYRIDYINSGVLRPNIGTTQGVVRTTPGEFTETILAAGSNPRFSFYSSANCQITVLNIKNTKTATGLKEQNTIAFSEKKNKWTDFRTFNPDFAMSLFTNFYSFKNGVLYIHRPNSPVRNNFYGNDYQTIVKVVFNDQEMQTKTYQSISIQSNQLMITTEDGIETSLGQVSELIADDFLQATLNDGVDLVEVYDNEGVYSARFMRDKNVDIINGDALKGNYITVELITVDNSILRLFSLSVHSEPSRIGVR